MPKLPAIAMQQFPRHLIFRCSSFSRRLLVSQQVIFWTFLLLVMSGYQFGRSFGSGGSDKTFRNLVKYIGGQRLDNKHTSRGYGLLEVGDHLVEVLVDLGELGGELLVLEGVALLMEDLRNVGDQQQPLLGVNFGEEVGLAEEPGEEPPGGARGLLVSQDPGNQSKC